MFCLERVVTYCTLGEVVLNFVLCQFERLKSNYVLFEYWIFLVM